MAFQCSKQHHIQSTVKLGLTWTDLVRTFVRMIVEYIFPSHFSEVLLNRFPIYQQLQSDELLSMRTVWIRYTLRHSCRYLEFVYMFKDLLFFVTIFLTTTEQNDFYFIRSFAIIKCHMWVVFSCFQIGDVLHQFGFFVWFFFFYY